jgi:hypothetical protein
MIEHLRQAKPLTAALVIVFLLGWLHLCTHNVSDHAENAGAPCALAAHVSDHRANLTADFSAVSTSDTVHEHDCSCVCCVSFTPSNAEKAVPNDGSVTWTLTSLSRILPDLVYSLDRPPELA